MGMTSTGPSALLLRRKGLGMSTAPPPALEAAPEAEPLPGPPPPPPPLLLLLLAWRELCSLSLPLCCLWAEAGEPAGETPAESSPPPPAEAEAEEEPASAAMPSCCQRPVNCWLASGKV